MSGKVPFTMPLNSGKNYGSIMNVEGPNSLNQHWQPFGGTYFYASFAGPSNETTIANDHKVANSSVTGLPCAYFIQATNGRIENVLFNNEMNSYPLQYDTDI